MYFDSHAHLDDGRFDADRAEIFADLPRRGVGLLMNVGCDLPSSERSVALAHAYDFVYAAVGSHPDDAASVAALPLDRILIETDCPYMAPEPHRGHRNDSRLVPLVADRIAAIRGLDPRTVETATTENAKRLFRIP